jgi:hypothetical protein
MRISAAGLLSLSMLAGPLAAQDASGPLSAIDWLSQSVATPAAAASADVPTAIDEPPVAKAGGALPASVTTTALDGPSPDSVGLIAPAVSGLPHDLWGAGLTREIAERLVTHPDDDLPALRQLFLTLLLAEVAAPVDAGGKGELLQVRIDKLLALGALEQAAALIDAAGTPSPELFRRAFDVALLTGAEDRACQFMAEEPHLAPTLPARIFCLARSGDWDTAALTIRTSKALNQITADQETLLSRFLDPDLFEGEPPPPAPNPVTPLDWMIYAAIGEPLPTEGLPIAFSYAELSPRAGTIPPNVILGLYTERDPAASGGVWDRVAAFQDFEAAISSGDAARVAATLPEAWARMQEAELEVPFATLFGKPLQEMALTGEVKPRLWPSLGVTTGPVSIANADWAASDQPLFSAESLSIDVNLGALMGGEVKILGLSADQPQINLERDKDGQANWVFAASTAGAAQRPGAGSCGARG